MRFFKSIKIRLTIWYLVVTIVLLFIFTTAAYFMLSHNLYQNLDNALSERATELRATLSLIGGYAVFTEQPNELLLIYNSSAALLQRFGPNIEFTDIDDFIKQALTGQSLFITATTRDGQEARL